VCDKCVEHDKKIEHYRKMTLGVSDQLTVERIKTLIEDLQAQKASLYPEQKHSLRKSLPTVASDRTYTTKHGTIGLI
jgi:hypothetical protein